MTGLQPRSSGRAFRRLPVPILTVLLTAVLVAPATGAPAAAAMRSGPDIAVRAGTGIRPDPPEGVAGTAAPIKYVPPVPGVDPPAGVDRRFDPPEQEWGAGHRGVDLVAPAGTRVVSPGPGVVTFAGPVARRGVVVVTHPDGLRTSLEPVAASVPVGTAVTDGAVIGVVEGSTAGPGDGTTGTHCAPRSCVHWGVRRGERYIDPLSLLDRPLIVLLPGG